MKTPCLWSIQVIAVVLMVIGVFTYVGRGPLATPVDRDLYLRQLEPNDAITPQIDQAYAQRQDERNLKVLVAVGVCLVGGAVLSHKVRSAQGSSGCGRSKPTKMPEL